MQALWPKAFFKNVLRGSWVLLTLLTLIPCPVLPADQQDGPLKILEELVQIKEKENKELSRSLIGQHKKLSELKNVRTLQLNPHFLSQIFFFTSVKNLELANNGKCFFLALLENNLLKIGQDNLDSVVVDVEYGDKRKETVLLSREDYLGHEYEKDCINNREIQKLMGPQNFTEMINKIGLQVPKSEKECQEIFKGWSENLYTPYLCHIDEILGTAKKYQTQLPNLSNEDNSVRQKMTSTIELANALMKKMNYFEVSYLRNLCGQLDSEKNFCKFFLQESYWGKVLKGERFREPLAYRCQEYLHKTNPTLKELTNCVKEIEKKSSWCESYDLDLFPSLYPRPHCPSISRALIEGKLLTHYGDCPGKTRNESILQGTRIINHFLEINRNSNSLNCYTDPLNTFYALIKDITPENTWNFKLCYYDTIEDKELCIPFIPGDNPQNKQSETYLVAEILKKSQGAPEGTSCELTEKKAYKPQILQFRRGCFLVYEHDRCTSMSCPKEIIFNEKPVTNIRYQFGVEISYFPYNYKDESNSLESLLKRQLQLKSVPIRTLSILKELLKSNPTTIIHGIGCGEGFMPAFFKNNKMNQCHPIPFIIDGQFTEDSIEYVVIRSGIDDIHTPRIIPWNYVYSGLLLYQELHPLKGWKLYALSK